MVDACPLPGQQSQRTRRSPPPCRPAGGHSQIEHPAGVLTLGSESKRRDLHGGKSQVVHGFLVPCVWVDSAKMAPPTPKLEDVLFATSVRITVKLLEEGVKVSVGANIGMWARRAQ